MPDSNAVLDTFHRFRDALFACDTETLDEILAPEYRGYDLNGNLETRSAILEAYRPGTTTISEWEISDLQVEEYPEVGILTGVGYVAGEWKGEPWSHRLRFCDVYVKRGNAWVLLLTQATPTADL